MSDSLMSSLISLGANSLLICTTFILILPLNIYAGHMMIGRPCNHADCCMIVNAACDLLPSTQLCSLSLAGAL